MPDYGAFFNPFRRHPSDDGERNELVVESEILEFANTSYFPKLLVWLEKEAARPLKIGDHSQMIQSAVRANTLREIRDTLVKRVEFARAAMSEDTE